MKLSLALSILCTCLSPALGFVPASLKQAIHKSASAPAPALSIPCSAASTSQANPHSLQHKRSHARARSRYQRRDVSLLAEKAEKICNKNGDFDLTTALFCGGLAFDAYAEPPVNSSRWERGVS